MLDEALDLDSWLARDLIAPPERALFEQIVAGAPRQPIAPKRRSYVRCGVCGRGPCGRARRRVDDVAAHTRRHGARTAREQLSEWDEHELRWRGFRLERTGQHAWRRRESTNERPLMENSAGRLRTPQCFSARRYCRRRLALVRRACGAAGTARPARAAFCHRRAFAATPAAVHRSAQVLAARWPANTRAMHAKTGASCSTCSPPRNSTAMPSTPRWHVPVRPI